MKLSVLLLVLATMAIGGCQTLSKDEKPAPAWLYQELGEREGIASIVEDLLFLIVEDERINEQFRGIDVAEFHRHLTDQLCQLSGGPCTYTGRDMREAHKDMNITNTQFNALAENLILAMEKNGIATSAQNRLIERLVPMYPDIRNL